MIKLHLLDSIGLYLFHMKQGISYPKWSEVLRLSKTSKTWWESEGEQKV